MGLGGLVLGSPILYLKGMRILMFQLSGFYCSVLKVMRIYIITLNPKPENPIDPLKAPLKGTFIDPFKGTPLRAPSPLRA